LDEAFRLIDLPLSYRVGALEHHRLTPRVISGTRGGEIAWIYPTDICRKFGGKRLRIRGLLAYREPTAFAMLIWRGRGKLNGRIVRPGDEFFVPAPAAGNGLELRADADQVLEAFTFFPAL
jgi:hypothetical protein